MRRIRVFAPHALVAMITVEVHVSLGPVLILSLGHFGRVHVVLPFSRLHIKVHARWGEHDCRRALQGRRDKVVGIVLLRARMLMLLLRRLCWPLRVVWWLLLWERPSSVTRRWSLRVGLRVLLLLLPHHVVRRRWTRRHGWSAVLRGRCAVRSRRTAWRVKRILVRWTIRSAERRVIIATSTVVVVVVVISGVASSSTPSAVAVALFFLLAVFGNFFEKVACCHEFEAAEDDHCVLLYRDADFPCAGEGFRGSVEDV